MKMRKQYIKMWDTAKVVPEKCIALNTFIRKEKFQINNLVFHFKTLNEEDQKIKGRRKKEIMKRRNQRNYKQ